MTGDIIIGETGNSKVNDLIARTVAALRSSRYRGDGEIHRTLVADGIEPAVAARLVEFLPMAYCRLLLERSGARFSDMYRRRLNDGQISAEKPLSSEPLWNAVLAFARDEVGRGIPPADLLAVAGRSAEFDVANQLLNRGSKLKDIAFVPVVLKWPEEGPDTRG
jgi:hypothetical protein